MNTADYPRVTTIISMLQNFSGIDPEVLAYAAERGTEVHEMVSLDCLGQLDNERLHPALIPYYVAWQDFLIITGFEILESEKKVENCIHKYRGTTDLIGFLNGKKTLIDIKTRIFNPRYDPIQTAAYVAAYNQGLPAKEHVRARRVLSLTTTNNKAGATVGKFKLAPELTDSNDFKIFLSCLAIHNFTGGKND